MCWRYKCEILWWALNGSDFLLLDDRFMVGTVSTKGEAHLLVYKVQNAGECMIQFLVDLQCITVSVP